MGDEEEDYRDNISTMFKDNKEFLSGDEALTLDIIHRYNLDRETIDSMPAIRESTKPLFGIEKEK
jgi:hypothetical protein